MSAFPDASSQLAAATRCVALGRPESVGGAPVNPAIVLSSTYRHGGAVGYAIGNYYRNILPGIRRPYALLWRDVHALLLPAAAGRFHRGNTFAVAARNALDELIAQQGFRDLLFMVEVQEQLADGDRDRLLALLPRSREALMTVEYRLVHGPRRACWEGYLPAERASD